MIIAIIKEDIVANLIICDTIEHARQLLPDTQCINGTGMVVGKAYPPGDDTAETPATAQEILDIITEGAS